MLAKAATGLRVSSPGTVLPVLKELDYSVGGLPCQGGGRRKSPVPSALNAVRRHLCGGIDAGGDTAGRRRPHRVAASRPPWDTADSRLSCRLSRRCVRFALHAGPTPLAMSQSKSQVLLVKHPRPGSRSRLAAATATAGILGLLALGA